MLYLKGMRTTMFQLSGFYCRPTSCWDCALRSSVSGIGQQFLFRASMFAGLQVVIGVLETSCSRVMGHLIV